MSFIKTTDNINMNSKVLAAGVIDANSGAQWYESRFFYESTIDSDKVWAEVDRLKLLPASNRTQANLHVAANTDLFTDYSVNGVRLTPVPGSGKTTWTAYATYNDVSSARVDGWIQPQMIPQVNGAASVGYAVEVYVGGDSATGTRLSFTQGQTGVGADAAVSWIFNYSMGVLLFAPDAVPTEDEIWIYGYCYNGDTGGGSDSSSSLPYCQIYEAELPANSVDAINITRNAAEPLDPGITVIGTEALSVTLKVVWERLTESGLGFNSMLPTINGTAITQAEITSTNFYDKVLYAEVVYDIADGDITLGHNGETTTIKVEVVTKPTADITVAFPTLPWDSANLQTELKNGDAVIVTINNQSEALDMVRLEGGDVTALATDTTTENAVTIGDADVNSATTFTITNTETLGNRDFNIFVRATATGAWSLVNTTVVPIDNIPAASTHEVTYPVNQFALKANELATSTGTTGSWDTVLYTPATGDVIGTTFTEDSATEWSVSDIDTNALDTTEYRYDDVSYGSVRYRKSNGMENTVPYNARLCTELPTFIGAADLPFTVRHGDPATTAIFVYDQPLGEFAGDELANGVTTYDSTTPGSTYVAEITRAADVVPVSTDFILRGVQGPALLTAADITVPNAVLFNGFVQQTLNLGSGVRTGNVPIQVDLTNHPGSWTISWDATESNVPLTATFDTSLTGTKSPDQLILLRANVDGTLDFEILFSDTTLSATTIRIEQAAL